MLAHHDGAGVRLISRRGLDWGWRRPTCFCTARMSSLQMPSSALGWQRKIAIEKHEQSSYDDINQWNCHLIVSEKTHPRP
jgi:hypothetical protein